MKNQSELLSALLTHKQEIKEFPKNQNELIEMYLPCYFERNDVARLMDLTTTCENETTESNKESLINEITILQDALFSEALIELLKSFATEFHALYTLEQIGVDSMK